MLAVSLPALAFTGACALLFAASDYFRKTAVESFTPVILLTVFVSGQVPILAGWAWATNSFTVAIGYWPWGALTAVFGLAANLMFILSLRASPLSLTIPVLAFIPVLTTLLSTVVLGEKPSTQQTLGILLTVLGLFVLYAPPDTWHPVAAIRRFAADKGARYMFIVTVLWSATGPLDKLCIGLSSPAAHATIQVSAISITLILWLTVTGARSPLPTDLKPWRHAGLASIAAGAAYGFQLAAFQLTLVGVVESLKRVIGLLSALTLGRLLLGEAITGAKITGILLMSSGVPLIVLPPLT